MDRFGLVVGFGCLVFWASWSTLIWFLVVEFLGFLGFGLVGGFGVYSIYLGLL